MATLTRYLNLHTLQKEGLRPVTKS